MRNMQKANIFPGTCFLCGKGVEQGEGVLFATRAPHYLRGRKLEWKVKHKKHKCPKEQPNDQS